MRQCSFHLCPTTFVYAVVCVLGGPDVTSMHICSTSGMAASLPCFLCLV